MNNSLKRYNNLLTADLYKLGKLKSVIVAPIVMLLLILVQYGLFWAQFKAYSGAEIPAELLEYVSTGRSMLFGASSYINLGLFMAIFCGIYIGGDFKDGTINTLVARGADRVQVYFSKWLTMVTLACGFILGSFLLCGIFSGATGYGAPFDGAEFGLLMRSLVLQLLVGICSTSIYVFIAFTARSQGATIGISLGLYFISGIVIAVLILIGSATGAEWLTHVGDFLPSQQLSTATSYNHLSTTEILEVVFVPIGYLVLSCGLGVLGFVKRDIK